MLRSWSPRTRCRRPSRRPAGPEWLGLGVTAPYKRLVATLLDEVEDEARAIGAVNNVVRTDDGRLVGFNTDAPGFRAGVELAMGARSTGAEVVVVGAGGAARAVVHALPDGGRARLTLANRTPASAEALVAALRGTGAPSRRRRWATTASLEALGDADLAVNATTVGMIDPGTTIPVERLPDGATVFDLVYVPAETPLVAAARARGLRRPTAPRCWSRRPRSRSSAGPGVGGMDGVMREAVAPLLADPTAQA